MKIKILIAVVLIGVVTFVIANKLNSAEKADHAAAQTAAADMKPAELMAEKSAIKPAEAAANNAASHNFLVNADLPACTQYLTDQKAQPDGHAVNKQIEKCAYQLFETEDFAALDSSISYLKQNQIRSPNGYWLQTNFYVGLETLLAEARDEASYDAMDIIIKRWIKSSPDSDTAKLELAHSMMGRASLYRGTGYADTVSEENFEKFYKQVSATKKYLLENETISKRDPEWYFQMLNITNVERNADENEHKKYFDQAIKLYPDYYPIYFSAAQFYLAKWHGDAGSFEQFAKAATSTLDPDQAKAVYARIYRSKICSKCGSRDITQWRDHWSDIKAGMDQVIKDFPDQWNINTYAQMSCAAKDQEKTRELVQKISGEPIADAWNDEQYPYYYCSRWAGQNKES